MQFSDNQAFGNSTTIQTQELEATFVEGDPTLTYYVRVRTVTLDGQVSAYSSNLNTLTGKADFDDVSRDLAGFSDYVRVYPFLNEIQNAYLVADIAVSRAGASAVFELAAFGVPAVFVPYPYAADDHQKRNVDVLANNGAAVVIDNPSLNGESLETIILSLLEDKSRRADMSARLRTWSKADADDVAAGHILDLVVSRRHLDHAVLQASTSPA